MVHGLEKFKEYFGNYTSQYVLIGGTACSILMEELGTEFRATQDLDIVLIIEALDSSFGETFWKFIEDGGYEHRNKGRNKNQFYRFKDPKDKSFPKMIELFSKLPNEFEFSSDRKLIPIHIDESIISLSAILLNDDYYNLLLKGRQLVDGFSVIGKETIILFKIKAWLDMKKRREDGENVDMNDIRKHKNDIFRLLAYVYPTSRIECTNDIQNDVIQFIQQIKEDKPDLKNLRIKNTSFEEMLKILEGIFLGKPEV